jgi:dephospho-CoA kinase
MTKRIAIAGGPRTGKTRYSKRLAEETGLSLTHTDDFIDLGWSEASQHVADLLTKGEPGITEGVAVPRALRKMLAANPHQKPVDKLIVLESPKVARSSGQVTMAKGVATVLDGILPDLRRLGVEVVHVIDPTDETSE